MNYVNECSSEHTPYSMREVDEIPSKKHLRNEFGNVKGTVTASLEARCDINTNYRSR